MLDRVNIKISRPFTRWQSVFSNTARKALILPIGDANTYLKECEALRGLAILLVVLFHSYLQLKEPSPMAPTLLNAFILAGNTGVTLFFVLSSFLLNLPFMAGKPINLHKFFIKRALRILPMYGLVVIVGGIYHRDIITTIESLIFLNIKLNTLWPFGSVWWSLAVEVQFYLLLPWLHLLWRLPQFRWVLIPLLFLGSYLYLEISRAIGGDYYFIQSARDSILALWPTFFCGAGLAAIHARHGAQIKTYCHNSRLLSHGGADIILCLLALALAIVLRNDARLGPFASYLKFFDHVALEAFLWSAAIAATLYLPAKIKIAITNPAFTFLGLISYSLYLIHFPAMFFGIRYFNSFNYVTAHLSPIEIVALCVTAAIILSSLTYYVVEKPLLNLKARYSSEKFSRLK